MPYRLFSHMKICSEFKIPNIQQVGNLFPVWTPAWTALTVSSGAVVADDPAPRGAETGRWTEVEAAPAEVIEAADGKTATLGTPTAAPGVDGAGATAEGPGVAEESKWAERSFPWTPEPCSSFLLFVKSIPINHKLISLIFFQFKITFIPTIKTHNSYNLVLPEM